MNGRTCLLISLILSLTEGNLMDILKRGRRNYQDEELANKYWGQPVKLGVYVTDFAEGGDGRVSISASKRTDTPLHPAGSGSGSGSGSMFFSDSAKRDKIPTVEKPQVVKPKIEEKIIKKSEVNAMKKSELTAKATKVEVQGADQDDGKRATSVTCQGEKEWLQCPQYHLIKITSAFWGRDDTTTCTRSNVAHGRETSKMCAQDESNTMIKVQNACDGESACELVASQVYFDRTDCPDIYKYLRLNWECARSESRIKDSIEEDNKAAENPAVKGTL